MILNIGCGKVPIEGAVNHDGKKYFDHVDVTHDLDEYPWPWEDEEFDEVQAIAVLLLVTTHSRVEHESSARQAAPRQAWPW